MPDPDQPGLNRGHTIRRIVGGTAAGKTLLAYLLSTFQHADAQTWRERIAQGQVLLDDAPTEPDSALRGGQVLIWTKPPWVEPPAPLHFDVLLEDEHLIAVSKPSGLPTLPGAGFNEHTLLNLVRAVAPGASPMHRLGRGTSGIVLFAKTQLAGRSFQTQWRAVGAVEKIYRGLVVGTPPFEDLVVDTPIGLVPDPVMTTLYCASPTGKPSRSRLVVLENRGETSLLDVHIETGRPHQIRIHTAASGHPLVGDPLYAPGGGRIIGSTAFVGDVGYHLHAHRLRIDHPASRVRLQIDAPIPELLRTR